METTILVDQDNTLTDFNEVTVRYARKMFGYDGPEDIVFTGYNILKSMFPGIAEEAIDEMFEVLFSTPEFWSSMKPLEDCIDVMAEICSVTSGYNVLIVTKPWPTSKICIPEKLEWISNHLPFFDQGNVIFCGHKDLLHADIMIDDSPTFLAGSNCKETIAIDYPYNRDVESTYRVKNWSEIGDILL